MAEIARADRKAFDLRHQRGFPTITVLCLVFLYAPIALLLIYSFNSSSSLTNFQGFSIDWYMRALQNREIQSAAWVSIRIAITATIVSTVLATAAALATARSAPFRGMLTTYVLLNFPLMVPEIITAIATLSFFAVLGIERIPHRGAGAYLLLHTLRLYADPRAAGRYGWNAGASSGRSLRHALGHVPTHHFAAALARYPRRRHARFHRFDRRLHHHLFRRRTRLDHLAHLHLLNRPQRGHAGDQRRLLPAHARFDRFRQSFSAHW
jgi:ABC-type phosphate/phosphonate transport system permease subunit